MTITNFLFFLFFYIFLLLVQHPLITELPERNVRIQIKDQIDRMRRKKLTEEYEYSGSDEEPGSLDPPTIKKQGTVCGVIF